MKSKYSMLIYFADINKVKQMNETYTHYVSKSYNDNQSMWNLSGKKHLTRIIQSLMKKTFEVVFFIKWSFMKLINSHKWTLQKKYVQNNPENFCR